MVFNTSISPNSRMDGKTFAIIFASPGSKMKLYTIHVIAEVRVMTNVTATPMPIADDVFWETPRNGQSPRNFDRTKLLTKTMLTIIIATSLIMFHVSLHGFFALPELSPVGKT